MVLSCGTLTGLGEPEEAEVSVLAGNAGSLLKGQTHLTHFFVTLSSST